MRKTGQRLTGCKAAGRQATVREMLLTTRAEDLEGRYEANMHGHVMKEAVGKLAGWVVK